MDGLQYWYSPSTKAATWEKPFELRSVEERAPGDWTWVPHPQNVWQPARRVKDLPDGLVETETIDKKIVVVPASKEMQSIETDGRLQKVPLWPLKKFTLNHPEDDLIFLEHVNEASILYNLNSTFQKEGLYTWVGASHRVLVAVNPYKRLNLYGDDHIAVHRDKSPNIDVPPHVFDIADGSYQEMLFDGKHQSILISGESGAGKTEATKHCLKYWAKVAGSKNGVERKLIEANPVLEAYGNAKTIRNNNSSRFGKWVEVYFDQIARSIDGAIVINYLLEKSRLVYQQAGERNFHIFYYLLGDSQTRSTYSLRDVKSHRLTTSGLCSAVPGLDDAKDFGDAKQAMVDLEFSPEEREWLLRLPASLLHLGDVAFVAETRAGNVRGAKVADNKPLELAAKFLDVSVDDLTKVLLNRSIAVNRETSVIPLDPEAARAGCDSIVKGIYSRLFDWLVQRCNKALNGETTGKFVGILDIFGFEIFEVNSFEQLCINFCNEKLQQLFNQETFRDEESLYVAEGIKYDPIVFVDSEPVLNMIEKGPYGILPVLDDECKLPEGNDDKFMSKVNANLKDHPSYGSAAKRKLQNALSFDVIHYAGQVCYTADEFMAKNKDTFFNDAFEMGGKSGSQLTKNLFPSGSDRLQTKSLSSVFRSQLNVLMEKLRTTSTRYVRCIKPNETMSPLTFEAPLVLRQLTYSGVFEAVAIRKQGFPFRMPFSGFAFRYKAVNPDHLYRQTDPKKMCEELIEVCPTELDVVFGRTMVFYKAPTYKTLKLLRNLALETIIPRVQGILRGATARAMRSRIHRLERDINDAMALKTEYTPLKAALDNINKLLSTLGTRMFPKIRPRNEEKGLEYLKGLEIWNDAENTMIAVFKTDINSNYAAYWAVYEKVQTILHVAKSKRQEDAYLDIEKALKTTEKGHADIVLFSAVFKALKTDIKAGLQKVDGMGHTNTPPYREAQRLLALAPKPWFEYELQCATRAGDDVRAEQCKFRLWEIEMSSLADSYTRWSSYKGLRSGQDYAKGKWFGKTSCAEGMCVADKAVINQPLIQDSDPNFKKIAKDMNKAILVYCGLKQDGRGADQAGAEALAMGARSSSAKNELYCQLFKAASTSAKITDAAAYGKAYDLLGVALYSFPPEDDELLKFAFKFAVKKDAKFAKAASYGKFKSNKQAPRDVSRVVSEINAWSSQGSAVSMA